MTRSRATRDRLRRELRRVLAVLASEAAHLHHLRELRGQLFDHALGEFDGGHDE